MQVAAYIVDNRQKRSEEERFLEALELIDEYKLTGTIDWVFRQLIPDQVEQIKKDGFSENKAIIERLTQKDKTLIVEVVEAAFLGLTPIIPCKKY